MKTHKNIIFSLSILLISLFFLINPSPSNAQLPNTFDCAVNLGSCDVGAIRCDTDNGCTHDAADCWSLSVDDCETFGVDIHCDCPASAERITFSPNFAGCDVNVNFLAENLDQSRSYTIRLYRDTVSGPESYQIDSFGPNLTSYANSISFNITDDWNSTSCEDPPPDVPTGSWEVRLYWSGSDYEVASGFLTLGPPMYVTSTPSGGGATFAPMPTISLRCGYGIETAIGCIPVGNMDSFVAFLLRWALGIGGGIAFILIVFSAFQIITSSGNPEKIKAGQELLTAAVAGILFMIFAVFILEIIGVRILVIPGF